MFIDHRGTVHWFPPLCVTFLSPPSIKLLVGTFSRLKEKTLSALPHSHLLKILSCFYASEMGDRKVLSKGLQVTNPDKWQIWYQWICSVLFIVTEQKAQDLEENIYTFIPQISKEHKLCAKCRESSGCIPQVAQYRREETHITPFFIMIIQSMHFSHLGGPCSTFSHQLLPFTCKRKWEFCLGNFACRVIGQMIKDFHGSGLL